MVGDKDNFFRQTCIYNLCAPYVNPSRKCKLHILQIISTPEALAKFLFFVKMVNYLCRICFFINEKESIFRKIGPFKYILDLLLPEIRDSFEVSSIVCVHCYNFLYNIERFRVKSLESDLKLHDRQVVTALRNDPPACQPSSQNFPHIQHTDNIQTNHYQTSKLIQTITILPQTVQTNNNNLDDRFKTLPMSHSLSMPRLRNFRHPRLREPDGELLILNDIGDIVENELTGISNEEPKSKRQNNNNELLNSLETNFVAKPNREIATVTSETEMSMLSVLNSEILLANNNRNSTISNNITETEIIELDSDDEPTETLRTGKRGWNRKIICRSEIPELSKIQNCEATDEEVIKTEYLEDNPGFFNKRNDFGLYMCRLCTRAYKTSRGLYSHTKLKHKSELKFHYCVLCNFFTIWRSALERHNSTFHTIQQSEPIIFRCYNCTFTSESKDELEIHLPVCNSRLEKIGRADKKKRDRVSLA